MRSDNLRPAPGFFTPELVGRVVEQLGKPRVIGEAIPVEPIRPAKPKLRVVETEPENQAPPAEHARRAEEGEAAAVERGAVVSPPRQNPICEAKHRAPRQAARSAAPREPAALPRSALPSQPRPTAPQPPRAHPISEAEQPVTFDRDAYERKGARQRAAARKRIEAQAIAIVDGDDSARSESGKVNAVLAAAIIDVKARRAAEARRRDPVEQAKTVLQRRFAPVCSMSVYGGDPELFCVGHRKNLTKSELLELAERYAA